MNDNNRILRLDCWTAGLDVFFLFLLRFWGYCILGIYGERLVFFGVVLGELGLGYVIWLLGCGVDSKFCFNTVHCGFLRYQELQRGRVH